VAVIVWLMDLHTLITEFVIKLIRRVPLVGHELPTLPEHLSSPPVFSWIRVTRSLVLCVCFVDRCLSFCTFFLWPLCCLLYGFLVPLWYLQTLLTTTYTISAFHHWCWPGRGVHHQTNKQTNKQTLFHW
jgi:hypothetical protein